jgi:hypothetical protein
LAYPRLRSFLSRVDGRRQGPSALLKRDQVLDGRTAMCAMKENKAANI